MSEKSISSSRKASILAQFVRERFLVAGFFTSVRLSCRDDPNGARLTFSEYDHDEPPSKESEADLPFFSVLFPGIGSHKHRPAKHLRYVHEIYAVLDDIRNPLGFVPFEPHMPYCNNAMYLQQAKFKMLTSWLERMRVEVAGWRVPYSQATKPGLSAPGAAWL
jgi:hypothetical protein